ncbi:MAG TPA: HNH endonuclease [Bacteroidales bacterium]|nr:HNH endonuclease [Bacteroidales bacterium]
MNYFIGNTDYSWYRFLRERKPEDVNFWQPGGLLHFRAVEAGAPFLLKLKSPINKVAGIGFFTSHSILPIGFAWEVFGERNGSKDYVDFFSKIKSYRDPSNSLDRNPNIGCIVLTNPVFFDESDWIPIPADWSGNIVQGKTYNTISEIGNQYWSRVSEVLQKYQPGLFQNMVQETGPQYGKYLTNVRIGQGAFRILVTDAYFRRCAVSGERTLPVLESAHIKPYAICGINDTNNGLLLRADLHKLFDSGYITVTDKFTVEISRRIKEEFENGRDYYRYHGKSLESLPGNSPDRPNPEYLRWHNENLFKS